MQDARQAVEQAQAESEANREKPLPTGVKGQRHGRSVVQSVRLPVDEFEAIERIAEESNIPVSALIRGWVLQGLHAERDTSLRDAIERVAIEADRLRHLASISDVA